MSQTESIAHLNGELSESIYEHGMKTMEYGDAFSKNNSFYERMSNLLLKVIDKNVINTNIKEVNELYIANIKDVLFYHDFGKLNTSFQDSIKGLGKRTTFQREHSIGSSCIYLYEKLNYLDTQNFNKPEMTYLQIFILLNSWIISRHHSKINDFNEYTERLSDYINGVKIEELRDYKDFDNMISYLKSSLFLFNNKHFLKFNLISSKFSGDSYTLNMLLFLYTKLVFGFLCQSDYLATSDFMSNVQLDILDNERVFNTDDNLTFYNKSEIVSSINKNRLNKDLDELNKLRIKVSDEVINTYESSLKNKTYLVEAMTGIGKTNISVDLGLRIMADKKLKKFLYVFPYNSIVDQTKSFIQENVNISGETLNSITDIDIDGYMLNDENEEVEYNKVYLDRLTLNVKDGLLLTSHVNLSNMLFGTSKDSAINLINLTDSLIIMDEIHAYTSDVWELFLKGLEIYKDILGLEVVYMSATMPNFSRYIDLINLVPNFNIYTKHDIYMKKYSLKDDLLYKSVDEVYANILDLYLMNKDKKNLVGFITKVDANNFYNYAKERLTDDIYLLTSETSKKERLDIIKRINESDSILVIATQVIEVGVDIDMDVCYGHIRSAASLEQLVGRLNRNNRKENCLFYLFSVRSAEGIYKDSYIQNPKELIKVMKTRDYTMGYFDILQNMKDSKGVFDKKQAALTDLKYNKFSKEMELISDDTVSVYLNDNTESQLYWNEYKDSLNIKGFGKRKVLVHNARVQLNDYVVNVPSSYVKKYDFESSYDAGYYVLTEKVWLTK